MHRFLCGVLAAALLAVPCLPAAGGTASPPAKDDELQLPLPAWLRGDRRILAGLEGRAIIEEGNRLQRPFPQGGPEMPDGLSADLLGQSLTWRSWAGHPLSSTRRPQRGGDLFQLQLGLYRFGKKEYQRASEAFGDLLASFPSSPLRKQALYWLAESSYGSGEWEKAEKTSLTLLGENPGKEEEGAALLLLGWISQRTGELADALEYYRRFLAGHPASPSTPSVLFAMGQALNGQGKFDAAAEQFRRAFGETRSLLQRERSLFWMAESLRSAGSCSRALERYDEYLATYRRGGLADFALYGKGWCQIDGGNFPEAGRIFAEVVRTHPGSFLSDEALLLSGWCLHRAGLETEAVETLTRLETDYPFSPWTNGGRFLRGIALFNGASFPEAAELFETMAGEEGDEMLRQRSVFVAALSRAKLGQFLPAAAGFASLVREDGTEQVQGARALWGWAAFRAGRFPEAEKAFLPLLRAPQPKEKAAEISYWLGRICSRMGEVEKAALHFGRAREAFPEGPRGGDALFALGRLYYSQKRWREAANSLRPIVDAGEAYPFHEEAVLLLAESCVEDGKDEEAMALLETLLSAGSFGPAKAAALLGAGKLHMKHERYDEAERVLRLLLKETPSRELAAEAMFEIARSKYRQGRFEESLRLFDEISGRYPRQPQAPLAQLRKADSLYRLRRFPESLQAYRGLVTGFPSSRLVPEAEYGINLVMLAEGNFEEYHRLSLDFADRHRDNPLTPTVLSQLGRQLLQRGEYEKAENVYFLLIGEHPREVLSNFALLQVVKTESARGDRPDEAVRLRDAIEAAPSVGEKTVQRFRLANLRLEEGDCRRAVEEYRSLLAESPSHPLAQYALLDSAGCRVKEGDAGSARSLYRTLTERYPDSKLLGGALFLWGSLALEGGLYGEAGEVFARVNSAAGRELEYRSSYGLAKALENLGRKEEAYDRYRRTLSLFPGGDLSPMAALRAADIARETGRTEEARDLYRTVIEGGGEDVLVEIARDGLNRLTGAGGPAKVTGSKE